MAADGGIAGGARPADGGIAGNGAPAEQRSPLTCRMEASPPRDATGP
jgi:hypothetical protein